MFLKLFKKKKTDSTPQKTLFKKYPFNAVGIENNQITHGENIKAKGACQIEFWRESTNNKIIIGKNFQATDLKIRFKGNNSKLIIGDDVRWSGYILIVGNNRQVVIGDRSTANGAYIMCRDADISIDQDCMLSREIEIRSTDVHKIYDLDSGEKLNNAGDVFISEHVWIAARAIISKGVKIPKGSVVGAASFVNKGFDEENVVIAGTPAKIVKRNIRWER